MKHIYRRGLAVRYRSIMQIICGVHYNYSLPEPFWTSYQELSHDPQDRTSFINDAYFDLARNVQRYDWLITYLFGCSPALCKSFMDALDYPHDEYDRYTLYQQYATSLRQSDIGYKNQAASLINVSYDSLDAYVASLYHATRTPYPPYEAFGIFADGEYRQLNANLLQIENEYYGSVRPKRVGEVDERPLKALARGGVQYVELRSLDVNAFEPTGINVEQLQFLEAFLLFCLFQESPSLDIRQRAEAVENQQLVSHRGREPGLHLHRDGQKISLVDWAAETLDRVSDIASLLDRKHPQQPHTHAVNTMRASVLDADRTPSAQMIKAMDRHNESFFEYAGRLAEQHQAYFARRTLDSATRQLLNEKSETSRRQRIAIEEADSDSFEVYLARYFGQMSTVLAHDGSP